MLEALESGRAYSSVSLSSGGAGDDDDDLDPLETIGTEEHQYEVSEDRAVLEPGFRVLDDRERRILHLRFFEGLTQSQIAAQVGISQMHVSRLIRRSLEKIRDEIAADEDEPRAALPGLLTERTDRAAAAPATGATTTPTRWSGINADRPLHCVTSRRTGAPFTPDAVGRGRGGMAAPLGRATASGSGRQELRAAPGQRRAVHRLWPATRRWGGGSTRALGPRLREEPRERSRVRARGPAPRPHHAAGNAASIAELGIRPCSVSWPTRRSTLRGADWRRAERVVFTGGRPSGLARVAQETARAAARGATRGARAATTRARAGGRQRRRRTSRSGRAYNRPHEDDGGAARGLPLLLRGEGPPCACRRGRSCRAPTTTRRC